LSYQVAPQPSHWSTLTLPATRMTDIGVSQNGQKGGAGVMPGRSGRSGGGGRDAWCAPGAGRLFSLQGAV
jgi:hypothetical protein